jgi:hypothetical protein
MNKNTSAQTADDALILPKILQNARAYLFDHDSKDVPGQADRSPRVML